MPTIGVCFLTKEEALAFGNEWLEGERDYQEHFDEDLCDH
jgi:hypothetical protein